MYRKVYILGYSLNINNMKQTNKIYTKKCKICGKIIKSLSEQQCAYNFGSHELACKMKIISKLKKGAENGKTNKLANVEVEESNS